MPLTIDDVVEKYRSLGSDATIAANLRRHGMSASLIKKAIADHRAHTRTDAAEREQSVERFRAKLIARPRAEQIISYLSLYGSHERAIPLWESTIDEPPDVFWPVVLDTWNMCDGMRALPRGLMLETFRFRAVALSPIKFMEVDDLAFFDRLPDPVTVFRGCGKRFVRGMAWTTDRSIAEFFASGGRFPTPHHPVIATAEIEKSAIFFCVTSRNESEIVLDPHRVKRLRLEPYRPAARASNDQ
jgi:hypothetical protein